MKKTILFFFSICIASLALAQHPTAKKNHIENFENFTLYVVLNGSNASHYDNTMREVIRRNWRVTKYDFITQDEFELKRTEEKTAFLIMHENIFAKDKNNVSYDFLSIIIGGNFVSLNAMPEVCTFPLKYSEANENEMLHKLAVIVGFFNQHIKNVMQNPKLLKDKQYKYYTKMKKSIAKKTTYLIADEQIDNLNTAQRIRPYFKGKIVIMGQEELANLVKKRAPNVVFLHRVAPESTSTANQRCYTIFMGTDNTLYYFDFHKVTSKDNNGLTIKHWKLLASFTN